MSKKIAFIDGKTIIDGKEVARAAPVSNSARPPNAGSAAYQHAMAAQRSKLGIEAPQASVDVMAQLQAINAANQKHINEQAAKVEALEEETSTLNSEVRELNNKIEAVHRAPRGNGGGFMGGDSGSDQSKRALAAFARKGIISAAMHTESNPDGGFLIEPEHDRSIRQLASDVSPLRRLADIVSVGTDTYIRTTNMGGVEGGWVSESQSRPEKQGFKLSQIEIAAHEMYTNVPLSQKLIEDAVVDIEGELIRSVNTKFGTMESQSFVLGSGVGQPYGFLSSAYTKVANGSFSWGKIGYVPTGAAGDFIPATTTDNPVDCLIKTVYSLRSEFRQNARWLMSSTTADRVRRFKNAQGEYVWSPSAIAGAPDALLGFPVEICEDMPSIEANSFPIAFADWKKAYVIIDRLGTTSVLRDPYTAKPNVMFYCRRRVGGAISSYEAIKLVKVATA